MNPVDIDGVIHLLTTIQDITPQKEAEEAKQISETKFSVLFEKASLPTAFTKAPEHKFVEVNEAFLELFEFQKEEIIGHTSIELGINRNIELRNKVGKEIETRIKPYQFEQILYSKSGKPINIFTSLSLINFGEEKFSLATLQDITASKKTELDLIDSRERYRSILDTMVDCVITIDEKGMIQSINQSAVDTFGYAKEELIGSNISLLMPETFAKEHDRYLENYKITGEKRIIGVGREVLGKRKDGSTLPIYATVGEFIFNGKKNFVGILKDITLAVVARDELNRHREHLDELVKERTRELNKTKEDLVQAKERAEHANQAKTQFLASASHDLRQPLQAANMLIYLIEGKVFDSESKDLVNRLRSSLDSLGELLNSLLDISKLDAGMIYPDKVGFPLSVIFEKIRNEMSVLAEAKGLLLRVCPTRAIVYSDPKLLEQILRNLLSNAIKYTRKGRILVGVRNRGTRLLIEVYDTGIGIPEDKLEKIFEEFYQINNSERNRKKGIGLGLAIVRRLVKLMGHSIEVRSKLGIGSRFQIAVPKSEVAKRKNWFKNLNIIMNSGSKVIVAIEDEVEILETLRMLLKAWGHTVITGSSASEAMENILSSKLIPEIILADYRLENNKTGIEAIHLIRSQFNLEIPALIITGDTSPDRLSQTRKYNLKVMHKPVNPKELKNWIDQNNG